MTDFEILKNEYESKVQLTVGKSRKCLLFTDKSKEDLETLFAKRKVLLITQEFQNVYSVQFANAITEKALTKLFSHFLLYSSFKQIENEIIDIEEDNVLEDLENEYIKNVNLVEDQSRNVLLFTDKSTEDIKTTFSKRKLVSIDEKEVNVISVKFTSPINEKTLKKLFSQYILYSSFKQNDTVIMNNVDKRNLFRINNLKKVFDDNHVDINELKLLSKEEFLKNYPQVFLTQKMISAVNDFYNKKMYEDMKSDFEDITWKPFQKTILDICSEQADARGIYLIEDVDKITIDGIIKKSGNIGKSHVCSKLDLEYNVILADGKKDNIFNQIKTLMEHGNIPNVIILDVPRQGKDYIQYGVLEQIKNGLIYSGKYEGSKCRYPIPHMFILANFRVDITQWSSDRIRFIDTITGEITNSRKPNVDGVEDYYLNDEDIDYKMKYYESQNEVRKLKARLEELNLS